MPGADIQKYVPSSAHICTQYVQAYNRILLPKRSSSDSLSLTSGIKSSPFDGLVWRFTVALAHCFHILGGVKPVAHLIHEFMLEIRHR